MGKKGSGSKAPKKGRAMEARSVDENSDSDTDVTKFDTSASNVRKTPATKSPAAEAKPALVVTGKDHADAVSSDEEPEDSFRRKSTKAKKHVQVDVIECDPEAAAYVRRKWPTRNAPSTND
jgi:hypothetical protein